MADLENDVIAGIGEEQTATNVIYPTFDATFRQFVVGKDCILDGLELSPDGLTLTAGHCLGKGFQGELKNDIAFEAVPQKIYGRFVINHADDTLDHFYIETDPIIDTPKDDILTRKGEYWLLLYENSIMVVDRDYPENAVNSDTTIRLIEDGTIAASAEVEGDIPQSPLTYDKRVASTGFVNEAITELIGYKTVEVKYGVYNRDGSYERDVGTIKLEKKADFVIATATRTSTLTWDANSDAEDRIGLVEKIPEQFNGTGIMYIPVEYIQLSNPSGRPTYTTQHTIIQAGSGAWNTSGWKINL